ncbi:hypothetical protein [Martelella mangrovi]|uniref:Tn3 transposase DDE domain-containing protein n=1 Tax=Martelella mangrovi TaxID=1397477 RepID=A0ABV2I7B0_9HYPH
MAALIGVVSANSLFETYQRYLPRTANSPLRARLRSANLYENILIEAQILFKAILKSVSGPKQDECWCLRGADLF